MTEHPVQEDAEPPVPALGDELGEIGFIPEAGVYAEQVEGVVAVGLRLENGAEQQPGAPQLDRVVEPAEQTSQP